MKILNLYAGIGGNRKLWGDTHDITSIEYDPKIASIYRDFFPNDNVIVEDAHEYLLNHFKEYDFIWSSPPCPTHSRARRANENQNKPVYPDMRLYQEIILLSTYFKGKFVIENVISYYDPLIKPQEVGMHYFWSNFFIRKFDVTTRNNNAPIEELSNYKGFDLTKYSGIDKIKILRNCVLPTLGKHIFDCIDLDINYKLPF